ncbi:unnamed protein product [Acanthoscelides obtectus]|uniref:Uncharacterized protein n=1 Tax=Acanthoscelides obtectus TaxID=200917 RepID=A0A9P0PAT6_ACAOB|nr:unnamed protein product [Acanthoscelides obtectus]CAK1669233.1 hypothetical protein AOBTE_LOCUS26887 [Acanthoscelides obtectus]
MPTPEKPPSPIPITQEQSIFSANESQVQHDVNVGKSNQEVEQAHGSAMHFQLSFSPHKLSPNSVKAQQIYCRLSCSSSASTPLHLTPAMPELPVLCASSPVCSPPAAPSIPMMQIFFPPNFPVSPLLPPSPTCDYSANSFLDSHQTNSFLNHRLTESLINIISQNNIFNDS